MSVSVPPTGERFFSATLGLRVHATAAVLTKSVDREVSRATPRCSRCFAQRRRAVLPRARTRTALRPGAVAQRAPLLAMRISHRIIPTEQNSVEEPQRKLIGLSQQRRKIPAANDEPAYLPV